MLQVIKKEFKSLDDLVKYINRISILYGHLKNYKILEKNDKYNLLMNFDVPEVKFNLDLAKLVRNKQNQNDSNSIGYRIELVENLRKEISDISFNSLKKGLEIQGYFNLDGVFDLIKIRYERLEDSFLIELRKFKDDYYGSSTEVEKNFLTKEIDYKLIYNHLIKLIFNRGYLLDFISLEELKKTIYYKTKWLNKKDY